MIKLSEEEKQRFLKDPTVVTDEILFSIMAVLNVVVSHHYMSKYMPYPIIITWVQMALGSFYAYVLGEFGLEFASIKHFSPHRINLAKFGQLFIPALAYITMITNSNILLTAIPSASYYPILASFAIVAHHLVRFFGCGQIYRPHRWVALILMLTGFLFVLFDTPNVEIRLIRAALLYGISSALYRGAFLERALHEVKGLNNQLQANVQFVGVLLLPFLMISRREKRFFSYIPTDFSSIWTILLWGCFSSIAAMPLVKNIISNKLIKSTGQPPWRLIELFAILVVFLYGVIFGRGISILGFISFLFVLGGRTLNSFDALINDESPKDSSSKHEEEVKI